MCATGLSCPPSSKGVILCIPSRHWIAEAPKSVLNVARTNHHPHRQPDEPHRRAAHIQVPGEREKAQMMAAHESPRMTRLYDRTADQITLDEVERIAI